MFGDAALLPVILDGTRLHAGSLVALAVAVAGWVLMSFTIVGFHVRVLGQAPAAARYAGFSAPRIVWFCLLLSGGLAGLRSEEHTSDLQSTMRTPYAGFRLDNK